MLHRFHQRFGTAGLVVAVIGLVLALAGGAYAASGALTGKQKKEVEKIAKKYAGKPGAQGPAGPEGKQGAAGANGKDGSNGSNGTPGKDGESVKGEPIATGGACGPGVSGVKYTAGATSTNVCNGKNGTNGTTGFTETLPGGKTETGIWGQNSVGHPEGRFSEALSFPIPLSSAPKVVVVNASEESKAGCPGRGGGNFTEGYIPTTPKAEPGNLCIYVMEEESGSVQAAKRFEYKENFAAFVGEEGSTTVGTLLELSCNANCFVAGTWAATAAEE